MFGKKKSWDIYIILEACFVCFGCFSGSVNKSAATFYSLGMPIFSALAFCL